MRIDIIIFVLFVVVVTLLLVYGLFVWTIDRKRRDDDARSVALLRWAAEKSFDAVAERSRGHVPPLCGASRLDARLCTLCAHHLELEELDLNLDPMHVCLAVRDPVTGEPRECWAVRLESACGPSGKKWEKKP